MTAADHNPKRIEVVAAVLSLGPGAPAAPAPLLLSPAVVIPEPGRWLLARKAPGKKLAGLWELPGGKIEPGEDPRDTLVREIAEELGLSVTPGAWVATAEHAYPFGIVRLQAWHARIVGGVWSLQDHDALAWVTAEEALAYRLAPADIPLVEALRG